MTFLTNLVTFGGQGVNFADICERFCDMWGVRGVNFDDLWGVKGSTLVTFVKDFVTFGGQGGQLW